MKKLLFLLLLVSGIASAQYAPTSSKTRFVNGIGLGTKSDAAFGTVDSLVLYASADSTLKFKFKGTARALMYAANVGAQIHDSLYAVYQLKAGTSAGARLVSNSGTVVALFGAGGGNGTTLYGGIDVVGLSNFSAAINTNMIRVNNSYTYPSGNGLELQYDTFLNIGYIIPINRSTSVYRDLSIGNTTTPLYISGSTSNVLIKSATDDATHALQIAGGIRAISSATQGLLLEPSSGAESPNVIFKNSTNRYNIDNSSGTLRFFTENIDGSGGAVRVTFSATGDIYSTVLGTGTVYSNSGTLTNTNPSDSTLKNTIKPLSYGLSEILKLQPKSFYYNSDSAKSSLKYGFIAQDVKPIMPDVVRKINPKDPKSKLGLETDGIYVTLVKAIQEQQAIIDDLKKRIIALENK